MNRLMLELVVGVVFASTVVFAQADLRSVGEKRDSDIIVRLSMENDLLRRQLQIVGTRCP